MTRTVRTALALVVAVALFVGLVALGATQPIVGAFAGPVGWWVGVGSAMLAILLLLAVLLVRPAESAGARTLRRGIRFAEEGAPAQPQGGSALERVATIADRLPFDREKTNQLQVKLERAAWGLRASEFRVIQVAAALAGFVIGAVLLASVPFGLVVAVIAGLLPSGLLARRIDKRANAFEEQLPDVLQLLAGSLRAGHGFIQAIDTVAREASDPAAGEFSRVVNESRLGGSPDDALEAMADRLESADFRWVVVAVNIQRQVGGNLAEILETVAETIRERERLRRHVRGLSAEGRMSAWILLALPFLLAGWMALVNPDYIGVLIGSTGGMIAIVIMMTLMGIGVAWMRKIIRIEI